MLSIMNLLAIETSSPVLSVAIKKGGSKLRHATVQGYMKHAENLLPVIDRLLRKEELKIGDIGAFLIDRGPGSFTGLRIGFATLKGFLAIRAKPCYGAFSLDVIATGIPLSATPLTPGVRDIPTSDTRCQRGETLTVCLDARRGKLYTRSYRYHGKRWIPDRAVCVTPIAEMARILPQGSWVAGDGVVKFDTQGLVALPEKNGYPLASTLIELFETKNPLLKKLARPKEFLPVYLRRSEAEEKLREKSI